MKPVLTPPISIVAKYGRATHNIRSNTFFEAPKLKMLADDLGPFDTLTELFRRFDDLPVFRMRPNSPTRIRVPDAKAQVSKRLKMLCGKGTADDATFSRTSSATSVFVWRACEGVMFSGLLREERRKGKGSRKPVKISSVTERCL